MDIRALHRQAMAVTGELVETVQPGQLDAPTPCAGWTLHRLLTHMIGQNHGFAAAARGDGATLDNWADRAFAGLPGPAWLASAADITVSFTEAPDGLQVVIPEIHPTMTFEVRRAIGFHYLDTLVHGWDVAAALGVGFEPSAELAQALLPIAEQVPAGPGYRGPQAQFAEVVSVADVSSDFDRALAMLGRDPRWAG